MKLTREDFILAPPEIKDELVLLFGTSAPISIFDIGACEGEDAVRYSRLFPASNVFLFEPRPDNLEKVRNNIAKYQRTNINVSDLALSNENGKATFYLSSGQPQDDVNTEEWDYGNKSSSLLPPGEKMKEHTTWLKFNDTLDVTTRRLDDFCAEHAVKEIHFIHMDVQGAELMVLEGAGKMIHELHAIWLEVEAVELYKDQPLKTDVENFMAHHGFVCVKSTVNAVAGDQLYVNPAKVDSTKIHALRALEIQKVRTLRWKHRYHRIRKKLFGK